MAAKRGMKHANINLNDGELAPPNLLSKSSSTKNAARKTFELRTS